jgi:hypothetical protein
MTVSDSFRELADLIDRFEAEGFDVIEVTGPDGSTRDEGTLDVRVTLHLPDFNELSADDRIDLTPVDATVTGDGAMTIDVDVSIALEGGTEAGGPAVATEADEVDEPAYKDPDRLQTVYNDHDSFPAMKEALGVDVSAQTVRRHMIDHGIHEPEISGATDGNEPTEPEGEDAADEDIEEPADSPGDDPEAGDVETTIADGIDLPEGITLDDIKETVLSAQTIHDVQARLNIDRERTRRLLTELDLLDLVSGRLTDEADRSTSMDEIDQRIRESAPPSA